MRVGEEGRGNQHAIHDVVQGVTHHDQCATGFLARLFVAVAAVIVMAMPAMIVAVIPIVTHGVLGAMIIVTMTPEQKLLEDEEQRDAGDQRDTHLVHVLHARALHGMRDQRQQRRA